jgi:hypothetical protein
MTTMAASEAIMDLDSPNFDAYNEEEDGSECEEVFELLLQDYPFDDQEDMTCPMTDCPLYQTSLRQVSEGSKSNAVSEEDLGTRMTMMEEETLAQAQLKLTGRPAIQLYLSCNPEHLSPYQVEIRKQIQFFEATLPYVNGQRVKGRNKAIVLGQVGVQCRNCARVMPPQNRAKGSTYFPQKLVGIYQAAQILSTTHLLEACPLVPPESRQHLKALQQNSKASRTAGKDYWASTAQALGVYEDEHGLRFEDRIPSYDTLIARQKEGLH